jgi:molybdopterin-containing oxidoreductase family membrane subunit
VQKRFPKLAGRMASVHQIAPVLAIAGLCLSLLHQSSLGATYGVLLARPIWYKPGLAVLFIVSAMAAGPSLTIIASTLATRVRNRESLHEPLFNQLSHFIGWILVLYLYLRFWDTLGMVYTHEPGRSEGLQMLTSGSLSFNFWVGEILLGAIIPILVLLNGRLRQDRLLRTVALAMVVGGLIAYRWDTNMLGQFIVFSQFPQDDVVRYTHYTPALIEIAAGAGVIAYGLLAFTLGARYLKVVEYGRARLPKKSHRPIPVLSSGKG